MAVHPTGKKENNSAEREVFLYASHSPPILPETRKMET